jgi:hypothetical protein
VNNDLQEESPVVLENQKNLRLQVVNNGEFSPNKRRTVGSRHGVFQKQRKTNIISNHHLFTLVVVLIFIQYNSSVRKKFCRWIDMCNKPREILLGG